MVKASSGSGLNNVDDYNIFYPTFATDFGFTKAEVTALIQKMDQPVDEKGLENWYNGYLFGTPLQTIYNPWSVLKYLKNPVAGLLAHWKNTSNNALIQQHLVGRIDELGLQIQTLLNDGVIEMEIEDNFLLDELEYNSELIWSLFTFEGYLTVEKLENTDNGRTATLRIPNKEVHIIFRSVFMAFLNKKTIKNGLLSLTKAIFCGDEFVFGLELEEMLKSTMSYFDFAQSKDQKFKKSRKILKPAKPIEAVYQAFIVGILLHLQDQYRIRSNREAAFGRADVLIIPKKQGETGAVLELKVVKPRFDYTPEEALTNAINQLKKMRYADQVIAEGAGKVFTYAVVFDGKRCWVKLVKDAVSDPEDWSGNVNLIEMT